MITPSNKRSRRILLLSAYDAGSHQHWRRQLVKLLPQFEWQPLTLPPRHFSWRLRGNSLSWAFGQRELLSQPWDVLLSSSMTDLSALRGFVPALTRIPNIVYWHENQFAYPCSAHAQGQVEQQMLGIYTALCADQLVFNSRFNRDSFHQGANRLLARMPDGVPAGLAARLYSDNIIPVPVAEHWYLREPATGPAERDVLVLTWNHRWEYDKGPQRLLALVRELIEQHLRFRLHVVGQQFRRWPEAFDQIGILLAHHYQQQGITPGQFGHVANNKHYHELLRSSDVVLSTADHDFQGLSILEATACGCTPLAPAHQVYPEYLPAGHLYAADNNGISEASRRLQHWAMCKRQGQPLPQVDVTQFRAARLRADYLKLLSGCQAGA